MRKILVNTLATTCAALILVLIINVISLDKSFLFLFDKNFTISAPFFIQLLGVNFVINLALYFTYKFECKYVIVEMLLDLGTIISILLVYGAIFDQFTGRRWIFAVIAALIYSFAIFANMARERADEKKMNESIQKRRKGLNGKSPFIAS